MLDTSVKNLMFDLGAGREIYDTDSNRVISKAEASDTIRKASIILRCLVLVVR